jgi:integrase
MRTGIHRLTERFVERQTKPGVYSDGGGLYLRVSSPTAKQWVFRYKLNKHSHNMSLGPTHTFSLEEARAKALAQRKLKYEGIDPIAARRTAIPAGTKRTFGQVAEEYISAKAREWTYVRAADDWRSSLKRHAPLFLAMPVEQITRHEVLALLEPLWPTEKHKIAKQLQFRIEAILGYATVKGYRSGENPARWKNYLDKVLLAPAKVKAVANRKALPWADMPALVARLHQADTLAALAIEFIILTGARVGEVIKLGKTKPGLQWDWIDRAANTVTFPASVMRKNKRPHRVPLSDRCLAILDVAGKHRSNHDDRVFPISEAPIRKLWDQLAPDYDLHGCRSTLTDWLRDEGGIADKEVRDKCIAHYAGSATDKAYNRSDLLELRRPAMQAWADYCAGIEHDANVVQLPARA